MTRKILPLTVAVFTGALGFSAAPVWSGSERGQYQDQHSSQIQAKGNNGTKTARSEMTPGYVKEAQQALKERGYHPGPIDGVFGPRTRAALRSFQHYSQLQPTGELDQETIMLLVVEVEPTSGSSMNRFTDSE